MEKKRGPAVRKKNTQSGPSVLRAVILSAAVLVCIGGLLLCGGAKLMLAMELPNQTAGTVGLTAAMLGTAAAGAVFARCSGRRALGYGIAIGAILCVVLATAGLIAGQQAFTIRSAIRLLALCCAGALGSAAGGRTKKRRALR